MPRNVVVRFSLLRLGVAVIVASMVVAAQERKPQVEGGPGTLVTARNLSEIQSKLRKIPRSQIAGSVTVLNHGREPNNKMQSDSTVNLQTSYTSNVTPRTSFLQKKSPSQRPLLSGWDDLSRHTENKISSVHRVISPFEQEERFTPVPSMNPRENSTVTRSKNGLLVHITLPDEENDLSLNRSSSPQKMVSNLREQLKQSNPGVTVDWTRPTSTMCQAEQDFRFLDPNQEPLTWPSAHIGESVVSENACFNSSLEFVRRPCIQDGTYGAQWGDPTGSCAENVTSPATWMLLKLSRSAVTNATVASMTQELANALAFVETPQTGDVLLLADALERISSAAHALTSSCVGDLASVLDGVLRASEAPESKETLEKDANATRRILQSMDEILARLQIGDEAPSGIASATLPRAALLVADVLRSGVTGIVAMHDDTQSSFTEVEAVRGDHPFLERSPDLAARLLGAEDMINKGKAGARASFVLLGTARTFKHNQDQVWLNSRVLGVTLTGGGEEFTGSVELVLKPLQEPGEGLERHCAFWDLEAGAWSTEGCRLVQHDPVTGRDLCQCTHLTHFAEIIGVPGHSLVLDTISVVGCTLSIFGLLGIGVTAAVFRQWRSRLGNKILLHLSCAVGLTMSVFLAVAFGGAKGGTGDTSCIALGALLHYSVLASFCWMLVSAALQLLRFVVVMSARPPHFLLKGVLFGWGVPLMPVLGLLLTNPVHHYSSQGSVNFCYPEGLAFYIAVLAPVGLSVLANLTVFCIIVYRVSCGRSKRLQGNVSAMSERRMAMRQLRMSILLFFLLGLSWVFGLLALVAPSIDEWRLVFSYLFCTFATLQGLALFLFFVVWERKTRALWLATLPDTVRVRGTISSDTNSGMSPSTGTSSGVAPTTPGVKANSGELAPLKKRNTDIEMRSASRRQSNGYHAQEAPTYL